jgi:hypothetical protein
MEAIALLHVSFAFYCCLFLRLANKDLFVIPVKPLASDSTPLAQIGRGFKIEVLIRRERSSLWMQAPLGTVDLTKNAVWFEEKWGLFDSSLLFFSS